MNNRRNFIKTAGLGLAAVGVTNFANAQDDTKKTKVEKSEDGYSVAGTDKVARNIEQVQFKVKAPLHVPYNSQNTPEEKGTGYNYFRSKAFTHNPFTINCGGISGSPIIMDADGKFVGFMTSYGLENSVFSFDGKETLTVHVPEGQELFVDESGRGDEAWKAYNAEMMRRLKFEPFKEVPEFWKDVEYCTWVEQKMQSKVPRGHFKLLSHDFINRITSYNVCYTKLLRSGVHDEYNGFPKLGRLRMWTEPNIFDGATSFKQELKLSESCIEISAEHPKHGKVKFKVWAEVHRPKVHINCVSGKTITYYSQYESWRTEPRALSIGTVNEKDRWGWWDTGGWAHEVVLEPDNFKQETNTFTFWHINPEEKLTSKLMYQLISYNFV